MLEIKNILRRIDVDVDATIRMTQGSIVNFKSVGTVLLETLSGDSNLSMFDVHCTPLFIDCYKLNFDVVGLLQGGKWDTNVVVGNKEDVVIVSSCWQIFSLSYPKVS
jgi:hypothetical protein